MPLSLCYDFRRKQIDEQKIKGEGTLSVLEMITSKCYNISITENYSNGIVNKIFLENYTAAVKNNVLEIRQIFYKKDKCKWEKEYNSEMQCRFRIPLSLLREVYFEDMLDTRICWLEQENVYISIKLEKKKCHPQSLAALG